MRKHPSRQPSVRVLLLISGVVSLGLLSWDAIARLVNRPQLFPWPRHIIEHALTSFASIPNRGSLIYSLFTLADAALTTTIRVLLSTAAGIFLGFLISLLLFIPLKPLRIVEMGLATLRGIPLLALIPLFILWFGDSELFSVYGYITYGVTVLVASDSYAAASSLPASLLETARLMGARRATTLWHLISPALIHTITGTLQTVAGLAWAFAVGAELIVRKDGLGALLFQSYYHHADVGKLLVLSLLYAILGWLSIRSVTYINHLYATKLSTTKF